MVEVHDARHVKIGINTTFAKRIMLMCEPKTNIIGSKILQKSVPESTDIFSSILKPLKPS
jgi:hypothetical protein